MNETQQTLRNLVSDLRGKTKAEQKIVFDKLHDEPCFEPKAPLFMERLIKVGAALFVVRRGLVEVVRRDAGGEEVPLALLEPPASFEESAALGTGVIRWFSVRARGPVSLLALGKSDLDALMLNFPVLANKILLRLAGIMAARLQMLIDAEGLRSSEEHHEGKR